MTQAIANPPRFRFGKNWARFIDAHFSPQRVAVAQHHLLDFLKLPDLAGRRFLDIGCGSGLHSLAAWDAGAAEVLSFDIDADSVATTRRLRHRVGNPDNWMVREGSVLDPDFVASLPRADIVYSWGVLHHTGAMWDAVAAAASTMAGDGVLYLALYCSDVYLDPPPAYWLDVKRRYNEAGALRQRLLEWQYAWRHTIKPALRHRCNPLRALLRSHRGMSYWTDVRDWLGGWPMEFAGIGETKRYCAEKLGLELLHICAGEANTEYLFRAAGSQNYWDAIQAARTIIPLPAPFEHLGGNCWRAPLPSAGAASADSSALPRQSRLLLFEDGVPLGFAHQPHDHIRAHGTGRYSHWGTHLFFSASDNTDPNTNGRSYSVCLDGL